MSAIWNCCRRENFKKDSGYAWVVLVLSTISHSLHIGFSLAIVGNLTVVHQSIFGINLQQSGFISTVHVAAIFLFGPISSLLVHKFGCRFTAIIGGVCVTLGLGLSSLSTQSWHAFILIGLLAGIGIPCLLVSTSEILSLHFEKHKNLAFSLAIVGQYVGATAWPSVSQELLDNFGYSMAMLILASIQTIQLIVGILLKEPLNENHDDINNNNDELETSASHLNPDVVDSFTEVDSVKDAFISSEEEDSDEIEVNNGSCLQNLRSLLKSPQVWFLLIYSFLWGANNTTFFVYVNDCILHRTGSTEEEIALGITIIGVTCIVGALAVAPTSFLDFERGILNTFSVALFAASTIAIAFSTSKVMFYVLCAVWGLGLSGCIASLLPFISGFCAPNQLALLFGLNLFVQGIAVLSASPLVGYISEEFGAEYGLVLSGCFGVAAVICMLPVVITRIASRQGLQNDISDHLM